MAVTDRELAREQLRNLLSQSAADEPDDESSQEDVVAQAPPPSNVHEEATRNLLEQIVELARRPFDLSGIPAPQVNVQPPNVHVPAPTVHVEAPNVTVQVPPQNIVGQPSAPSIPVPWRFEFERHPNGSLKSIQATPIINT